MRRVNFDAAAGVASAVLSRLSLLRDCGWVVDSPPHANILLVVGKIKRGPRRCNGFTVIELLVVIGIVAILAALIYPVFGTARASAKTSACLSNLRQISFAVQMYINDTAGQFPALQNRTSTNVPLPSLDTTLLPQMNGNAAVFGCPADNAALFQTTGTSYFWNFTVNGQDVEHLFSIVGGSESTGIPLVSDKEGFHPDIKNRVNILYADGHVAKEIQFSTSLP